MTEIVLLLVALVVAFVALVMYVRERSARSRVTASEAAARQELVEQRAAAQELRTAMEGQRARVEQLVRRESSLATQVELQEKALTDLRREREDLKGELTKAFADIANKGLVEQGRAISDQQAKHLETVLAPFKARVDEFQRRVEEGQKESLTQHTNLLAQIRHLSELNTLVSQEANNLTRALKGDNQQQGAWGEVVLERLLEASGLRSPENYEMQHTTSNEDGARIRPDALVHLPDNKHIIIDSKVSLTAFTEFIEAPEGSTERDAALQRHMVSIRNHVKGLSEKKYETMDLPTPDFVLMFIPVESIFVSTLQLDRNGELYNNAWNKRIILVSPSTLLATLRTIASIWKIEMQNKNAEEIARQAGNLFDKFVGFTEDLSKVGDYLDRASKSYGEAQKKLSTGSGNLVGRAQKLRELGVKSTKDLPPAQ
jgi:DNA recombination protein RmuC